ncbi:hypothetical protein ACFWAR_00245 [Streptomyces sp. NPDC059917]|uniref:hypothetical protein n=1 Tax=Streptomyces sp. NPDC059917 TaxID=3347002 RepID=UPI003669BDB0
MAMGEAILATISGLGGAGFGVAGALWVQRAKRRDDAAAAAVAADRAERVLLLEIVATARVAVRAWWTNAQRILADLEAGRAVNAQQYEEEVRVELKEFTTALYRLSGRGQPDDATLGPYQRPLADVLTESARHIVDAAHRHAEGAVGSEEVAALATAGRETHRKIAAHLVMNTVFLTGRPGSQAYAYPFENPTDAYPHLNRTTPMR